MMVAVCIGMIWHDLAAAKKNAGKTPVDLYRYW